MPLVDLDDPEELRARWSALAAVAHATGFDRRWYADEHGWYHQDETGSDLRMVRLDGGRAVLFGFHTQHTQTAEADLLAGAPDWIGQPEVKRRIAAGDLGFVYGSFNGTWARASYPGDPWQPLDDGFLPIGEWITSDEEAAREMIEWAAEWADYLGGLDELLPVGAELIRTAATTGITPESLLGLFDRLGIGPHSPQQPDLQAALTAAAAFDSTTTHPSAPAAGPAGAYAADDPVVGGYAAGATAGVVAGPAAYVGESAQPDASADDDAPTDGAGFEPIDEDEESVVVPPGISPFTGQPIGEAADLVIGGSEPFRPEPPFSPEPPFRPDSPFAPEPVPQPPEPPYAPQPEDDPPYQPETAEARADGYGVVAKKPRLFRRRKHEDPEPAPPPPPVGTPYAGGPAAGEGQYQGGPAAGTPYPAPAQHEASAPPMDRPLPSSEPPRVGGPVNDGEDFYASLFADAPAAATYVPDVVRNTPATPPAWSADDATSELTAVPAEPAAVTPDDDTGVITAIPEDTPHASSPSEAPHATRDQTPPEAPHEPTPSEGTREPHGQVPTPPEDTREPHGQVPTPPEDAREPHGQAPTLRDPTREPAPTSSPFAPIAEPSAPELEHQELEAPSESLEATPELFDAPTGLLEAITEHDEVAEPAPEPAPAQREWIGGAWINGVWVEDVAAYLAAQNAAGPTQPTEQPPAEQLHGEDPSDQHPLTEELHTEDLHHQEPPAEELRTEDFRDQEPLPEEVRAEEPPTEERFLDLPELDASEDGSAQAASSQELPEEEASGGELLELGDDSEQVVVRDDALQEPAHPGVADGQVEDEAPTAEIAAIVEEDPEDEYYASGSSPFAPQARDLPPNGFSSLESLSEPDYRMGEDEFHDQIIGDADWTADQLGDLPATEVTAQIDPMQPETDKRDLEGGEVQGGPLQDDPQPAPPALDTAQPQAGQPQVEQSQAEQLHAGYSAPDQSQSGGLEAGAAHNGQLPGSEFPGREASVDARSASELPDTEAPAGDAFPGAEADARLGDAFTDAAPRGGEPSDHELASADLEASALASSNADAGPTAEAGTTSDTRATSDAGGPSDASTFADADAGAVAGAVVGEGQVEGEAASAGVPERLVVPDERSAVAIPGLGVVGGDGPRVEPVPGSIEEAMRAEVERPRPRPKETAAFRALRDWCRARTKIVPSGFTIQVQVLDPAAPSYRFDLEPPAVDDPQYGDELLTELLGELWIAESQSEQGGWLFARVDAAGRTLRIDRWYDSVPDWWDNPVESRLDVHGLVRRLNDRGPDWQPSYLEKLYTTAR